MTRSGKGQTFIEPTIDIWLRLDDKRNIVINDPKGELYKKFYYPARKRGFQVIAFNLINPAKTDIYNPLLYAVDAARKGDIQLVSSTIQNIGDTFFPKDKSDDPMWPSAANAAFQRTAYGLIDFYFEEEQEMLDKANREGWSQSKIDAATDELWGHVTLFNVYQMMTVLASQKSSDPSLICITDEEKKKADAQAQAQKEGKPLTEPPMEKDYLTLFFDATNALPTNDLRLQAAAQDDSLRAMAKSEKTIASFWVAILSIMVYNIVIKLEVLWNTIEVWNDRVTPWNKLPDLPMRAFFKGVQKRLKIA